MRAAQALSEDIPMRSLLLVMIAAIAVVGAAIGGRHA